jgi:hypothetical protein
MDRECRSAAVASRVATRTGRSLWFARTALILETSRDSRAFRSLSVAAPETGTPAAKRPAAAAQTAILVRTVPQSAR